MAYHNELLALAFDLTRKQPANQADFRRAVSTAYYALFHLLIHETVAHWSLDSSRGGLARMFDHSLMKRVSKRFGDANISPFKGEDPAVVRNLRLVAKQFALLQDRRHVADYDVTVTWTQTDAESEVEAASRAFTAWTSIRHENIAQDYLVSLLIKPRD